MKIIRYTLLGNGKVPSAMIDGGYFIKPNGGQSPQDYDMIGLSLGWAGLKVYATKLDFENYIKSFIPYFLDPYTGIITPIQNVIDDFWARSLE